MKRLVKLVVALIAFALVAGSMAFAADTKAVEKKDAKVEAKKEVKAEEVKKPAKKAKVKKAKKVKKQDDTAATGK